MSNQALREELTESMLRSGDPVFRADVKKRLDLMDELDQQGT